jgi:hypothetical protein
MATKIGLGEITDTHLNNFGMITGGAKPGSSMYETALANLVKKGGDDLRGVSDPLEHIASAVSRHIEENGMTANMRTEHARISEALAEGREITPFNSMMHKSRDYGMTMREGSLAAPAASVASTAPTSSSSVAKTGLDDFLKKDVASAASDYSKNSATQINHGWKIHFDAAADEASHEVVRKKLTDAGYDWKYGQGYGAGKNYTVYPQSLERRDAIIKMIEEDSDLSNSILKNSDIADSTSLNMGNQVLSERTTGRFTTGYHKVSADTDFNSARPVDFSGSGNGSQIAQAIADDKGQPNRYIRDNWYSDTDTRSSHPLFSEIRNTKADIVEDIGHLQKNYPEIHELMMGKPGYSSPYGMPIAGLGSSPTPTPIIAAPPAAPSPSSPVPSPAISTTTDDLIEPSVVKKIENPTREAYDAARAKGDLIVTEPVAPKPPPSAPTVPTPTAPPPPAAPTVPPPSPTPAAPTPTSSVPPPTPAPTGDTVTAAGKARTMVKANYSAMSDDELLSHFEKVKSDYAEQLVKDPDGKAFLPTAKSSLEGTERELTKRGIHPGSGVTPTAAAPSPGKRPTIGTKIDDVTTTPKVDGPKVGKPAASTSSIEDLVDLADDQKRNMANLTNAPSGSTTTAAAKISSNIDDVDMTARQAMGFIGDQIKDLRKTKKILSNDGAKGVAEAVTQGIKGSKNLRLAALGTAVGLGGYAASRFQHRNNNSDLRG